MSPIAMYDDQGRQRRLVQPGQTAEAVTYTTRDDIDRRYWTKITCAEDDQLGEVELAVMTRRVTEDPVTREVTKKRQLPTIHEKFAIRKGDEPLTITVDGEVEMSFRHIER